MKQVLAAKRVRVPLSLQGGGDDCGLVSLEMIGRFYGVASPRYELRRHVGTSVGGTTFVDLRRAGIAIGLESEAFFVPAAQLSELPAPAILHLCRGHFVVYEGIRRDGVQIVDPALGRRTVRLGELEETYSGAALFLEPLNHTSQPDDFWRSRRRAAEPTAAFAPLRSWLTGKERTVAVLAGTAGAFALYLPAFVLLVARSLGTSSMSDSAIMGLVAWGAGAVAIREVCMAAEERATRSLAAALDLRFRRAVGAVPAAYLASRTTSFLENLAADIDPRANPRFPSLRIARWGLSAVSSSLVLVARHPGLTWPLLPLLSAVSIMVVIDSRARSNASALRSIQSSRRRQRATLSQAAELRAAGLLPAALDSPPAADAGPDVVVPPSRWPRVVLKILAVATAGVAVVGMREAIIQANGSSRTLECALLTLFAAFALTATLSEVERARVWHAALVRFASLEGEAEPRPQARPSRPPPPRRCGTLRLTFVGPEESGMQPFDLTLAPDGALGITGAPLARKMFAQVALGIVQPSGGRFTIRVAGAPGDASEPAGPVAGVLRSSRPAGETIRDQFLLVDPTCTGPAIKAALSHVGLGEWLANLPLRELTPLGSCDLCGATPQLLVLASLLCRPPAVLVLDGTLDDLNVPHARTIAERLAALPCAILLCTGRPEILSTTYTQMRLGSTQMALSAES